MADTYIPKATVKVEAFQLTNDHLNNKATWPDWMNKLIQEKKILDVRTYPNLRYIEIDFHSQNDEPICVEVNNWLVYYSDLDFVFSLDDEVFQQTYDKAQ